jgi:hypothetical protein
VRFIRAMFIREGDFTVKTPPCPLEMFETA